MNDWPDCPHCGREYRYDRSKPDVPVPPCCGEPLCRAEQYWTPEEWEGRARMARSAVAGGHQIVSLIITDKDEEKWVADRVPFQLNDWDTEALRRSP